MPLTKTHSFLIALAIFILIIIGYRYHQYIGEKNFILEVNTICSPETESCFSPDTEGSFDEFPYKRVDILYGKAPKCLEEHTCEEFSCGDLPENQCQITYCSEDTLMEGEECFVNI